MMFLTTGELARRLGRSREAVLHYLRRAGIEPLRDSSGRRLLTERDVERILTMRAVARRRAGGDSDDAA